MRGGPNLPDGVVDYLDLELSDRFPFSVASVLWTVVVATLSNLWPCVVGGGDGGFDEYGSLKSRHLGGVVCRSGGGGFPS